MPSYVNFNEEIEGIYEEYSKDKRVKSLDKKIAKRGYKMHYHMHPNRRLKKMFFMYSNPVLMNGLEANVPFFTISVNKVKKNDKKKFKCIYNNFYVGGIKEVNLNFSEREDDKGIKKNIKELKKVIKMIKYAFSELKKELKDNTDIFYKQ